jgi:hypothetical protein
MVKKVGKEKNPRFYYGMVAFLFRYLQTLCSSKEAQELMLCMRRSDSASEYLMQFT